MEQYLTSQINVQKAHVHRINVAMFRVAMTIVANLCLGAATLGYVFDYERATGFYAMFLIVVVAMAGIVVKALAKYKTDALEADSIRDRDLRVLKHAHQQYANTLFS